MGKGISNNQFKKFQINTVQDALLALGMLVSGSIYNLEKFAEYTTEALCLVKNCKDDEIPAKLYDDLHDKALFRQRELLALMADEANDIFSYRTLRKWLKTHEVDGKKLITRDLDQVISEDLNELHSIRNATFHNVQSKLVAEKEIMEHGAAEAEKLLGIKPNVVPLLNPLIVYTHKQYKRDMLETFIEHNLYRHKQFKGILNEMKQDYQNIYDSIPNPQIVSNPGVQNLVADTNSLTPVKLMILEETPEVGDPGSSVASLSMAIQKRKYDGSEKAYKEYTVKKEYRFDSTDGDESEELH